VWKAAADFVPTPRSLAATEKSQPHPNRKEYIGTKSFAIIMEKEQA
jgi:hypothetical protein